MTVAATLTSVQYTGNGSATQFSFNNKVFQASDLTVTLFDLSGNQYTFANQANTPLGLSYTVQNVDVDTGCLVVFNTPPTLNWTIDIRTDTPELQSTSIKNQGAFLPELHEEAFDRLTRIVQDDFRQTYTFGIHGPDTEAIPWPAMPAPAGRLGMQIVFDPVTGLPTVGVPTTQTVTQGLILSLLTAAGIGSVLRPATPAENAKGVVPTNLAYPPGNVLRYGADPTGAADSAPAFTSACQCNNYVWIPSGNYSVFSQVNVDRSNITIEGENQSNEVGGASQGGVLITYVNATSNTACFSWGGTTTQYQAVNINRIGIQLPNLSNQQIGIRFSQCVGARLTNLVITGAGSFNDASVGIQLDGLVGPYGFTGDFDIQDCYITNHLVAINVQGVVTTLRIIDNEMYGTSSHATNVCIQFGTNGVTNNITGPIVRGNTIEQWHTGIQSYAVAIRQFSNYFEGNNPTIMGGNYAISNITQASSAVVTISTVQAQNPFLPGNAVVITGVSGMTQINGLQGVVTGIGGSSGAWTATLSISSSAFSAYTSGGTAQTAMNWNWIRGLGSGDIENTSLYDVQIDGAVNFPRNGTDKCSFFGPASVYLDAPVIQSGAGFRELQRTFNLGYFTTPTFAAGNFTANGSMTWTVGAGAVTTYEYTVVGKMMTLNWFTQGGTAGGTASSALQIAIPGGFVAAKRTSGACIVSNTTAAFGSWQVAAAATVVQVFKDATQATNYTVAGAAADTWGSATFEIQ